MSKSKKQIISNFIDTRREEYCGYSDAIWEYAELGFREYKSAQLICKVLEDEGFTVEKNIAGIETAFIGTYGKGEPVIAVLGEYDALPRLSQTAECAEEQALEEGGNGHGCGHNLLGIGSLLATVAAKRYMEENGLKGTIKYYGCPGEEKGSSKTILVKEGCFEGIDAAFCWHPTDLNHVLGVSTLSNVLTYFDFHGKAAHASEAPFLGRSALDAVELMNVGANFLREHVKTDVRIHYAITDTGGSAPNVVQSKGQVYYAVRAPRIEQVREIMARLEDIARGAALMTGTQVSETYDVGMSRYIPNRVLGRVLYRNLEEIGAPDFDERDYAYANELRKTIDDDEVNSMLDCLFESHGRETVESLRSKVLNDFICPNVESEYTAFGSTDVGDVSSVVPTAQIYTACSIVGTPAHTWQFTSQSASGIGHKGMIVAAKTLALSVLDLLESPELIEKAKQELSETTGDVYVSPIPEWAEDSKSRVLL